MLEVINTSEGGDRMLEELYTFVSRIPTSYSIATPRLKMYLKLINQGTTRLIERNDRFSAQPIPSAGISYINSLITRADVPYLLKFENDMTLLMKVSSEYHSGNYSDFIRQYPIHNKSFIYSKRGSTVEYLLITDDFNLVDSMPMGSADFDKWRTVYPIRMLSNDSPELLLDITNSRLRYRARPPTEVVFSINVMKLLMVYVKYRRSHPKEFESKIDNYPFIYKVCLLPLLYDNVKNWMTKIVYDMVVLKNNDPSASFDFSSLSIGEKSTFILGNRQSALLELEDLITKCAKGVVRPDEIVNSVFVALGVNIYTELNWLMDSHYVGNLGMQYRWASFVREYFLLTIMIGIYNLQPGSNRTGELRHLFDIMSKRWKNTRFWLQVGNPYVASAVEQRFDELCALFK